MGGNGQDLGFAVGNPLKFHVAATLGDKNETKLLEDADDLVARQPTKLGHGSDRSRT